MVDIEKINEILSEIIEYKPSPLFRFGGLATLDKKLSKKCYPKEDALNSFNISEFVEEDYGDENYNIDDAQATDSPSGVLQSKQEELQREVDYTSEDRSVLYGYTTDQYDEVNAYLWDTIVRNSPMPTKVEKNDSVYLESDETNVGYIEMTIGDFSEKLTNIIDKSPRLQENCVLYRSGIFLKDLKIKIISIHI